MKIFISHPIKDEKLAIELKSVLKASDKIEEAHIAQKEKDFEIEISHKIIKQIDESDYLVAIITSNSKTSASVNQELGYSQGVKCPKIPLIEESAKKGCLIYGKDSIDFTRANFSEKCKEVLEYILENPKKKSNESLETESTKVSSLYSTRFLDEKMPNETRAYRRITIVPSGRFVKKQFSNDIIEFVKRGPDMFTLNHSKLKQNEIHLIGNNNDRYGIINENGQIVLQEILYYDKIVEITRELVYLLLTLVFTKEFFKKIEYSGALAIEYSHVRVQNFQFGPSPDDSRDIMDSHTVQDSVVTIRRSVNIDFDVIEIVNSILVEFGRASDWVAHEQYFVPYLKIMVQSYFPGRTK